MLILCGMFFLSLVQAQDKRAFLKIEKPLYKFGFVKQGTIVQIRYAFQNSGSDTLRISDIKVTCGCTVADFPEYPIPPGESGVLHLSFDTLEKYDRQDRTVEVVSNAINSPTQLRFKGVILPDKSQK